MSNSLNWHDLPDDLTCWPGLPLSLSGNEVMPLDYHAGQSGWLLYGKALDKHCITRFQRQLGTALVMVCAWQIEKYTIIRLAGTLTYAISWLAHTMELDVAPLDNIPRLHSAGLLVMDMDSTAIQIECIDEIARLAGTGPRVAEITERAMRGELDFAASLRQRVATLTGTPATVLQQVQENLPLTPGLDTLVDKLTKYHWRVAIASGGFTFFADYLRKKLSLTAAIANELEIRDGKLTGQITGNIVDAQYKARTLRQLAENYQIPLSQTIAIGDGANDLPMIKAAGLGIAFHAKPKVQENSPVNIRHADLMAVFCLLSGSLNHSADTFRSCDGVSDG